MCSNIHQSPVGNIYQSPLQLVSGGVVGIGGGGGVKSASVMTSMSAGNSVGSPLPKISTLNILGSAGGGGGGGGGDFAANTLTFLPR